MGICTIKRSSEFQRVRGGLRAANASFVIETRARTSAPLTATDTVAVSVTFATENGKKAEAGSVATDAASGPRFGFTVTRKIGNAVVRNRIRRRFKEALRSLPPGIIVPGHDYVVIARPGVIEQPFAELKQLLATTIAGLHRPRPAGSGGERRRHSGQPKIGKTQAGKPKPKTLHPEMHLFQKLHQPDRSQAGRN